MTEPLLRQWVMLRMIPRLPKKIDPPTLHRKLADEGYPIDLRSVQRDLNKLSAVLPLVNDGHKPAGWSWEKEAPPFDMPGMDAHTAITFRLVEQQLAHHLPRSTLTALQPHFKLARGVLGSLRREGLPAWADKVRAIPRGQRLLAPKVSPSVLQAVYDALLEEKRLKVKYRRRGDGQVTEGEVNPLGLVYRDSLPYLVCTWWGYSDVRQLVLSRMEKAQMLDEKRKAPSGFDLGHYVSSGETSFKMSEKPIRLVLRVHPDAAPSFTETPLDGEQSAVEEADGFFRIEASVADTRVLRGWLLSFGPMVEVLRPTKLRETLAEQLRAAASLYENQGSARPLNASSGPAVHDDVPALVLDE